MKLDASYQQPLAKIIQYAFNKKTSPLEDIHFISRYEHSDCYGKCVDQTLSSVMMVNSFQEQVFQSTVKMAGVGYVATLPEYRGLGQIQQLMVEIFQDLHQQGTVLSQLAPFSEAFYRQFGYENTSYRFVYTMASEAVRSCPTERKGRIERGNWEEQKQAIQTIYQRVMHSSHEVGSLVREDWWWQRLDGYYSPRHYAVAYDEENQPAGYMIYHLDQSHFIVDECCYLNVFALKKLMTFMKAHLSSFDTFVYYASMSDSFLDLLPEIHCVSIRLQPYMMTRIINLPALLDCLPLRDGVIIGVNDKVCPWNEGVWKKVAGQFTKVQAEPQFSADIETWTAYLLGSLSFEEGLFLEKWHVNAEVKEPLLYKGQQHFYDYF